MKPKNPTLLKKLAIAFAIVLLALGIYLQFLEPNTLEAKQRRQLESAQSQLIKTQSEINDIKSTTKAQTAAKDKKLKEIQKKLKETQRQLQAKRQADTAVAAAPSVSTKQQSVKVVMPSGSCADWIRGAGISDVGNAVELINRESGCNPNAANPSSGACGVAQELPCGKSGCSLGDGACQVRWMNSYVLGRYGSWAAAVAFHNANNWY